MIYFDHQSTSRPDARVISAMLPYLNEHYGNPQARFQSGELPRQGIAAARQAVADLIHAMPEEITFTASGTEANNLAIKGILKGHEKKGKHIVASSIEHHSILNPLQSLAKAGYTVSYVAVDQHGFVDMDILRKAIRSDTVLVVVTHASNEIGTIEPIAEISRIVHERETLLFADGIQTIGNLPVDVKQLGVDLMSMAGHQFYGPKGVAALFVRKGVRLFPLIEGGIQENGLRSGTENVAGIVGMGKAAELAQQEMPQRLPTITRMGRDLIDGIQERIQRVHLTGHPEQRLPGHASFCFEFVEGESMLLMLSALGIEGASGSTCSSHTLKASHVLLALGVGDLLAQGSLLFSLGKDNTPAEVTMLLDQLPLIVTRLRSMSPVNEDFEYHKESFREPHKH